MTGLVDVHGNAVGRSATEELQGERIAQLESGLDFLQDRINSLEAVLRRFAEISEGNQDKISEALMLVGVEFGEGGAPSLRKDG